MEKLEIDELVSKMDESLNSIKIHNYEEDPERLAQYLSYFGKLYDVPEVPIRVYSEFLNILAYYPEIIYEDGPVNISFAIGSLKKFCELADQESKKEIILKYVDGHLLYNAKYEASKKVYKRIEDSQWYKFALICEDEARKLGWNGRYSDGDFYEKVLEDSKLMENYNCFLESVGTEGRSLDEYINLVINTLLPELKDFVEANPEIKCKNALYALYSFNESEDSSYYEKYANLYDNINDAINEVIRDFVDNNFYDKIECCIIDGMLLCLSENYVESEIYYPALFVLLESAIEIEIKEKEHSLSFDWADGFTGLALYGDFVNWYKRIYIGKEAAGEPLRIREGSEYAVGAAAEDIVPVKETSTYDDKAYGEPKADGNPNEGNAGATKRALIWVGIPALILLIGLVTLFSGVGLFICIIDLIVLYSLGNHKYPDIMFVPNSIIINKKDYRAAVAYIQEYFKSKHFHSFEDEYDMNYNSGLPSSPNYYVNFYESDDDNNEARIEVGVSHLYPRVFVPAGFFHSTWLKDDLTKKLTEEFGV